MRQMNKHRWRLANSMAAFVGAAESAEQRDIILSQMVNAISSFGNSGLIDPNDDPIAASKISIDTIRNIAGPKE